MPFLIVARDKPGQAQTRAQTRPNHLAYVEANLSRLIAAGALLDDGGELAIGSMYVIDTDVRAEAESFIANDPYSAAGLFASIDVTRWRRGVFDHRSYLRKN
jgi:uncharacterized protein YciI